MTRFIGRSQELELLRSYLKKRSASFVVIRGRRRIGKSRLIQEFGSDMPCYTFSGIPPSHATSHQTQLEQFGERMAQLFGIPKPRAESWGDLFWQLGQLTKKGRVILSLDEISWIGSKDPHFLGQLKNAWDLHFSKNPKLILIVCGSVSSWIQKNILSSTGFLGRISCDLKLDPLPLKDAAEFWDGRRDRVSPHEILKVLSVTGSVPRYLEEVLPHLSAEENIHRLCFNKAGLLFAEFERIFSDLFSKRAPLYMDVVHRLANGPSDLAALQHALNLDKSGWLSALLNDLIQAGFVADDPTWSFKTGKTSRLKKFRLADNYLRFYLRYLLPNRDKIERARYAPPSLASLPGWESTMGLQFENLVIQNAPTLFDHLNLSTGDVEMYGPYFQRPTQRQKGSQVDLAIQTRHRTLFLCEIKFSNDSVGLDVVHQMKEKRVRLQIPRHWSTRQVLIHVNGITQGVRESQELDHIVDFTTLF